MSQKSRRLFFLYPLYFPTENVPPAGPPAGPPAPPAGQPAGQGAGAANQEVKVFIHRGSHQRIGMNKPSFDTLRRILIQRATAEMPMHFSLGLSWLEGRGIWTLSSAQHVAGVKAIIASITTPYTTRRGNITHQTYRGWEDEEPETPVLVCQVRPNEISIINNYLSIKFANLQIAITEYAESRREAEKQDEGIVCDHIRRVYFGAEPTFETGWYYLQHSFDGPMVNVVGVASTDLMTALNRFAHADGIRFLIPGAGEPMSIYKARGKLDVADGLISFFPIKYRITPRPNDPATEPLIQTGQGHRARVLDGPSNQGRQGQGRDNGGRGRDRDTGGRGRDRDHGDDKDRRQDNRNRNRNRKNNNNSNKSNNNSNNRRREDDTDDEEVANMAAILLQSKELLKKLPRYKKK